MKKLMIVGLLVVVLLVGLSLYLGQSRNLNAGSLSVEEMSQIRSGCWPWQECKGSDCVGSASCGSGYKCAWTLSSSYNGTNYLVCKGVDYEHSCSNSGSHVCGIWGRYEENGCEGALLDYGWITRSNCG